MTLGEFIARGRQAEVLAWEDSAAPQKVLKLFFPQWGRETVQWELSLARAVASTFGDAPAVFGDIVEHDGRLGIVYERVDGVSMIDVLSSKPWRARSLGRRLAEIHTQMHRSKPPGLPLLKDRFARRINLADLLSADEKARSLRLLEALPDSDALFHGDFHPGNVIFRGRDEASPAVIDWPNSATGDPLADVAQTRMLLSIGWRALPGRRDRFLARWLTAFFNRSYTARYCEVTGASPAAIARWGTVVAAARLTDNIPQERKQLLKVVQAGLARA
jgi:uncharacterized protein (TIGR02172 family)